MGYHLDALEGRTIELGQMVESSFVVRGTGKNWIHGELSGWTLRIQNTG